MRSKSDGYLRLYDYDEFLWKMVLDLFDMDNCDYPIVCGHYKICDNGQCICLTGNSENYLNPVDNR